MGIIRPLDEHLANQIAAGEVVERPASVLKELIENAVDAGASRIDVSAEEGGLSLLRVADNGTGIQSDDLLLAFQRHATSKIATGKDLFQILTLGFRGEALPSIAAVAKVKAVSSVDESGLGRWIEIEGGTLVAHKDTNAPKGTEILVKDLFYNTPARLKYMKSIQTELGHLSDVVYRQALARPDIAFTFAHNGNNLVRTPGNGELRQVIAAIYGTASAKAMIEVKQENLDYKLDGLTAMPIETRANRNAVTILINGRYVRSQAVMQPLLQAYHTLLPLHRYPLSVLLLEMHPTLVDVNVHPAKLEVRFSKENELRAFVESAVKDALSSQAYIPSGSAIRAVKPQSWVQEQIRFQLPTEINNLTEAAAAIDKEQISEDKLVYELDQKQIQEIAYSLKEESAPEYRNKGSSLDTVTDSSFPRSSPSSSLSSKVYNRPEEPNRMPEHILKAAFGKPEGKTQAHEFPELGWIGQLHGTYIVAQNSAGLYLIDQHAAHERIHYEYYYDKFGRPEEASQELLIPVTIEFAPDESVILRGRLPAFESAGVYMEDFGGNTFILRAIPHWFPKGDEASIVREMAEWIISERTIDLHVLREKAAILCSCKASIKANQALTREAGEKLLERLGTCRQPYTCPHGRPIVVSFSTYELEKMFKRVTS